MRLIQKLKSMYFKTIAMKHHFPISCKIYDTKHIKNSTLDGYNLISKGSCVSGSKIGFSSNIGFGCLIDSAYIGKYCCIAPRVRIVRGEHPTKKIVSVYPGFFSPKNGSALLKFIGETTFEEFKYADKANKYACVIDNDVWIGSDVIIIEGHHIGNGAVIAAGSVITKDIPPYEIWGGNPCHFIKKRFTESQIQILQQTRWWDWNINKVKKFSNCFQDIEVFCKYAEEGKFKD